MIFLALYQEAGTFLSRVRPLPLPTASSFSPGSFRCRRRLGQALQAKEASPFLRLGMNGPPFFYFNPLKTRIALFSPFP